MKKWIALIYIIVILIGLLCGCSNPVSNSQNEIIKVWAGESLIGYTEFDIPQDEWILSILFDEYEKLHPGVTIEYTYFEDEELMLQMLENGYGTSNMPDLFVQMSGETIKGLADIIAPLNKYIGTEEYATINYWDTVELNGQILGYPIGSVEVNLIAYNKELLKSVVSDYDNFSCESVSDFETILSALQEKNIQPILSNDRGYNQMSNIFLETWWMQSSDRIQECAVGERSFSEEPVFIESIQKLQDWYAQGFINQDYATGNTAISDFTSGKGAFLPTSIYKLNILQQALGDNLGIMYIPKLYDTVEFETAQNGGCGQCIAIVNTSNNIDTCADIIHYLTEKPNAIRMYQTYNAFPVQNNITIEDLGWQDDPIFKKLFPLTENLKMPSFYYMSAEDAEYYYKMGTLSVIGDLSAADFSDLLDKRLGDKP